MIVMEDNTMKKMSKFLALALALVLCLALCACGGGKTPPATETPHTRPTKKQE